MAGDLHPIFLVEEAVKAIGLVDAHSHSLIPTHVLSFVISRESVRNKFHYERLHLQFIVPLHVKKIAVSAVQLGILTVIYSVSIHNYHALLRLPIYFIEFGDRN